MRLSFPFPESYAFETLMAHLANLPVIAGLEGFSLSDAIYLEFPGSELTEQEQSELAAHVAAYTHAPTWTAVRAERERLFKEHDDRVLAALRQLRLATAADDAPGVASAEAELAALDAYGQALADVTEPPNTPDAYSWPPRPWETPTE